MFTTDPEDRSLSRLRDQLLATIGRLRDEVEILKHDLKRERQIRKEETEDLQEEIRILKLTRK